MLLRGSLKDVWLRTGLMACRQQLRVISTNQFLPQSKPSPTQEGSRRFRAKTGPLSFMEVVKTGAIFSGLYLTYYMVRKWYAGPQEDEMEIGQVNTYGRAEIGDSFTLVDHNGKERSSTDFLGQWVLLYFGFTHCPDICPEQIEKIVEVVNHLKSAEAKEQGAQPVQPLFITVDPKRDTVKAVKEYVSEFSPDIIGLTGTKEQILDVCKSFRVYHAEGPVDQDEDYIVDHTVVTYLMDPEGNFVDYFGLTNDSDDMKNKILTCMKKRQKAASIFSFKK